MVAIVQWITTLLSGEPHFYIGGRENPYMLRWYLIPRNGWLNIYLHKFMRDDDDRALHDHPWWFVSLMLWGGYIEHTEAKFTWRRFGSIAFRPSTHRHRVELFPLNGKGDWYSGPRRPCWTLVITGPRVREWGFWCPQGFVHWKDFVAADDEGNVGKGCGEH